MKFQVRTEVLEIYLDEFMIWEAEALGKLQQQQMEGQAPVKQFKAYL